MNACPTMKQRAACTVNIRSGVPRQRAGLGAPLAPLGLSFFRRINSTMADEGGYPERRTRVDRRARFDAIKADLTARLRAVCADMAPTEFEALVARMTRVQLRYEPECATWNQ